jgi:hypothetical protein
LLTNSNRNNLETVAQGKYFPTIRELLSMLITFSLTLLAWIFFRAASLQHALSYISEIFSSSLFTVPQLDDLYRALTTIMLVIGFVFVEWIGREQQYAIARLGLNWVRPLRWVIYSAIVFLIGMFMQTEETPFIYFQF